VITRHREPTGDPFVAKPPIDATLGHPRFEFAVVTVVAYDELEIVT
jgi:hypothetical protein